MRKALFPTLAALAVTSLLAFSTASGASNVGKRYPSEMRTLTDPVTHRTLKALTTSTFSDSKPYQTHPTWTVDGKWIIFRSDRGGNGSQAFVVNEETGDIIQLTDGPDTSTGSLNLSRKEMKLWYMRGGPRMQRGQPASPTEAVKPRELVELNIGSLISDSLAGSVKEPASYERVVATLPTDLRDAGGFGVDVDESKAYWGVSWGPLPERPTPPAAASEREKSDKAGSEVANTSMRRDVDRRNTNPRETREEARKRFEVAGRGPGGIRSIDLKTGEVKTVVDVEFRMGHVQTSHWTPGEIIYCHETTGDAPVRIWAVNADGSNNRPVYQETADEWITHETSSGPDEVMFNIMGHLPYLREHPTGVAVVNLRTKQMKILGQVEEKMENGTQGGFWHCNGSPDQRFAVADSFQGSVYLINRETGLRTLLTTGHKMRPDHTHPIFSADSKRVAIQSGMLSDGKNLNLMIIDVSAETKG
jgi:oligogalacturonide lyase